MHLQSGLQCPRWYACKTASVDLLAYTYALVETCYRYKLESHDTDCKTLTLKWGVGVYSGVGIYYLVRVSEIGRYFFWLLLCDRACPVQPSAFFLSGVLLLGFGKLLSIKKKCHCRFVVTCVGFTTNCQNKSRSKSLPPDIHSLLFYMPRPTP